MSLFGKQIYRPFVFADSLKTLTFAEICVLRPLNFHYGDYKQMQHGYQQKNGMCYITWKETSVEAAINALEGNAR